MATQDRPLTTGAAPEAEGFQLGSVVDTIAKQIFSFAPLWWWMAMSVSSLLLVLFLLTIGIIIFGGTGHWGLSNPTVWGMGIVNLIFWIGIGHAGTFISAFLLLLRQKWRGTFSRFAEAMTLFAVATAGIFPIIHVGRPEYIYYILPYPNTFGLNPQWRSALVWDVFAITTYAIISLLFWYIDLVPDLASMKDKAQKTWVKRIYGAASLGWRGESKHWQTLHKVAFVLAALAAPLVISVHSIVGLDFAISLVPGWHHTIFPPFFVGGAVLSGFAMVLIWAVILRNGFPTLKKLIPMKHISAAAILMLIAGLVVTYGYFIEAFGSWYVDDVHEVATVVERSTGPYAPLFWMMIIFNAGLVQLLWFKRIRYSQTALVIISLFVLAGMWLERWVIVPVSLSYTYMSANWQVWQLSLVDLLTLISPFGLFLTAMLLFVKFVPVLPMHEVQAEMVEEAHAHTQEASS